MTVRLTACIIIIQSPLPVSCPKGSQRSSHLDREVNSPSPLALRHNIRVPVLAFAQFDESSHEAMVPGPRRARPHPPSTRTKLPTSSMMCRLTQSQSTAFDKPHPGPSNHPAFKNPRIPSYISLPHGPRPCAAAFGWNICSRFK